MSNEKKVIICSLIILIACSMLFASIIPGPGEPGFDVMLYQKVMAYEHRFWGINIFDGYPYHTPDGLALSSYWNSERKKILHYGGHGDEGIFAGCGAAADAFKYGVTRDPADRENLIKAIKGLHILQHITGVDGLIARGFWSTNQPQPHPEPTPFFDENGNPLPPNKVIVWRPDNSKNREYPDYVWQDDVSIDQYSGYMFGLAAIWMVIADDPTFPSEIKKIVVDDARKVGLMLMRTNLHFIDADGRRTKHGNMNEDWEQPSDFESPGFRSLLALSFVLTSHTIVKNTDGEDNPIKAFYEELIYGRELLSRWVSKLVLDIDRLPLLCTRDDKVCACRFTNYNNYNMSFLTVFPLIMFEYDEGRRQFYQELMHDRMWTNGDPFHDLKDIKNHFWNILYLSAKKGGYNPQNPEDIKALADALESLNQYAWPPFWDEYQSPRNEYCDFFDPDCPVERKIDYLKSRFCEELVYLYPLPMNKRKPSIFMAKADPFEIDSRSYKSNEEEPGTDFRLAYWMGRYFGRNLPKKPKIQLAGYMSTNIDRYGGSLEILAISRNKNGEPPESVEILYQGIPIGIKLWQNQWNPCIFEFSAEIPSGAKQGKYLLQLLAMDQYHQSSSLWPYLFVK